MRNLKIKITGSGEKYAIAQMLEELAKVIISTSFFKLEEGVKWDDGILLTEITEDNNEETL